LQASWRRRVNLQHKAITICRTYSYFCYQQLYLYNNILCFSFNNYCTFRGFVLICWENTFRIRHYIEFKKMTEFFTKDTTVIVLMGPPITKLRETTSAIGTNYCLNKIEIIILTIGMKVGHQTFEDNLYNILHVIEYP